MNDLQSEIRALNREVAELRGDLEMIRSREQPHAPDPWEQLSHHLKQHLAQTGEPRAIGVARQVVLQDGQERGGGWWARGHRSVWTSGGDLSSHTQNLIDILAFWAGNPVAVRALGKLVERYPQGLEMVMPKAELVAALGVSEADLEQALRPFVANETLKWTKTAAGEECYEFVNSDTFLTLLSLAQK